MSSTTPDGNQHLRSLGAVAEAAAPVGDPKWAGFYEAGTALTQIAVRTREPEQPLELLERLGPSPFERGGFPLVGFLATTYDRVSRYALERLRKSQ
ncbi:MAG TPA: hypothetical protein PKK06_03260 [Phycisphaerae bacterium]|nr:hypothetical protein [Phycisphaerae bacterium]HNU44704.1 hypothetical protein [Phycisphaerae bacterium]